MMDTTPLKTKYVEWFSAAEMHKHSMDWLSELKFIQDEHLFFKDLVKFYTLQLLDTKKFSENKDIVDAINRSDKKTNLIIEAIKVHRNDLKIIVDGINQPKEEEGYKEEHGGLILIISEFLKEYQLLKTQLFEIIQDILKKEKQRLLLDKE